MEEYSSPTLESDSHDAQRKIGRNMLLFQRIEHSLKLLLSNRQLISRIDELADTHERKAAAIQRKSMGQLVVQFAENLLADREHESADLDDIGEGWVSLSFNSGHDSGCRRKLQTELEALVTERNNLIHHFLPMWHSTPIDEIHRHLDQQHERLLPTLARLKTEMDAVRRGRQAFAEYVESDSFKEQMELSWLRGSRLVTLLGDIAQQRGGTAGWVSLNLAGQFLRQHAPEDVAQMKQRYGHNKLKQLVLATQLFDIAEQPAGNGKRVVYRIKPQSALVLS